MTATSRTPRHPDEPRVLMLVPHDPDLDPRIGWVLGLLRRIVRTDVYATSRLPRKAAKLYDGHVYVERIDDVVHASPIALSLLRFTSRAGRTHAAQQFESRHGVLPGKRTLGRVAYFHLGAALRLAAAWGYYLLVVTSLYRRARAVNVRPTLIVSHDLYALIPAVVLKRRFGCRLLHDSHEYFPYADLLAPAWQVKLVSAVERRLIRHADVVVTVSEPLARELKQRYGLRNVIAVPNAEPRVDVAAARRADDDRVRFLVQGQASPGRGFEQLLELWSSLDEPRALLQLRCPDGDYPRTLRERFERLADAGRVEWLDPVSESELVGVAGAADVGVIPYVGPNPNHLYSCPNKLSQYMAAGLAVLSTDLPYVREVLARYGAGLTFDGDVRSFAEVVSRLVHDEQLRSTLQRNAIHAARDSFNWEAVSEPYEEALARLAGVTV